MKPGSIICFLLIPTGLEQTSLRRYAEREVSPCPGPFGYHNAHFALGDLPELKSAHSVSDTPPDGKDERPAADDPRWPVKCDHCEYLFKPSDNWQLFRRDLFRRSDSESLTTIEDAPTGAMWFAPWYGEHGSIHFKQLPEAERKRGHLFLKCPGGVWDMDSKSRNGDGWTRTGQAPNVTANPSILIPNDETGGELFHGWLRDGILSPC